MASSKLVPPKSLKIDFAPSEKQYELWELLQPDYCHICGGSIEQVYIGTDDKGNPQYKPECSVCHNKNLATSILGGGAAGKHIKSASLYSNV